MGVELFRTTSWSLVLNASGEGEAARSALEQLCHAYRPAVLAYVRLRGYGPNDAEDLTQGFFARMVEKEFHAAADPQRGRFRAFLLTLLKRHLINADITAARAKRGGGATHVSWEPDGAAAQVDPAADGDPERAFELAWAVTVVDRALARLRREAEAAGKLALFERLQDFLVELPDDADYARVAGEMGMRRNTLAVAVHRMRQRLRALICAELADTVEDPGQVDAELDSLRTAFGAVLR
ncbi:MAG TPA: sigma factor [Xanthomonadales bacterium]|nr:sigma factor [Xanthomonadales bacterium]